MSNYFCTWSVQNYLYGCGADRLDPAELEGARGAAHARERMAQGAPLDRLEREAEDFFARVARGYDAVAEAEPGRVRRIDSGRSIDEVFDDVLGSVDLN